MFYKQFSIITDILNPEFVEKFDYWLATLPRNNQKNITASVVSARLEVKYALAEAILQYAEKLKILEKYFLIKCPECDCNIAIVSRDELAEVLLGTVFCEECEDDKIISPEYVYTAYKVIKQPDVTEEEIGQAIAKKINQVSGVAKGNFSIADSLLNQKSTLYEVFYNPDESAYSKFIELRSKLDRDYGKNTTAKGKALEVLILEIFNHIKGLNGTNDIKTETNQFDCTCLSGINSIYPSVFNYMFPYFVIECKNEPDKKPNNTYCNKLLSIMDTNAAQLGIVFGRIDATSTCFTISREHYLTHLNSNKQRVILTFSDDDLDLIIDKRVNLLEYMEFKIFQVTANSPSSKFQLFS